MGARKDQRKGAKAQSDSPSLVVSWARSALGAGTVSLNGNVAKRRQERQERQEKILLAPLVAASPSRSPAFPAFLFAFRTVSGAHVSAVHL
jgi:hypothetical protein